MMHAQVSAFMICVVTLIVYVTSSSDVTLLDFIPYFPNYDFLRDEIPCSQREVECFKENKILYEADGKCYAVGEQGPCADGKIFHADKAESSRRGGHVRGTCDNMCPRDGQAPLAATGECMSRSDVLNKICRAEWFLRPTFDGFGQWVCEWSVLVCPLPQKKAYVPDTLYNGLCSLEGFFGSATKSEVPDNIPDNHPLLRYFANYTFLEREVPCTEEEKICFQYGRLLGTDGNCYDKDEISPSCEIGEELSVYWDEAVGKLLFNCCSLNIGYDEPPTEAEECRISYDEYREVCLIKWGLGFRKDIFQRTTCRCADSSQKPLYLRPSLPPATTTPGYCMFPDLSKPVISPVYDETLTVGFQVLCSEEEFGCLRENKVLAMGACYTLRTRGPCAAGEELVLDKEALAHAHLQPKCAPTACPEGSVAMPIDGTCFTHQQAKSTLCPDRVIALDEFGGWQCQYGANRPANFSSTFRHKENGTCELLSAYAKLMPYSWSVGGNVGGH